VVGDKLYFYASGRMLRDKRTRDGFSSTGLAVMRRDGFASMDGDHAGEALTTPAPGHDIPDSIARNTVILPRRYDLENLDVSRSFSNNPRSTWS